jgi:hypothetical protein
MSLTVSFKAFAIYTFKNLIFERLFLSHRGLIWGTVQVGFDDLGRDSYFFAIGPDLGHRAGRF